MTLLKYLLLPEKIFNETKIKTVEGVYTDMLYVSLMFTENVGFGKSCRTLSGS